MIYPNKCGICNKICKNNICEQCEKIIDNYVKFNKLCYNNKEFDIHIYFAKYEKLIREKILEYKFKNKAYLHNFFAEIIIKYEKEYSFLKKYDIITPVPIHKIRKIARGYNQTELIAKDIAKQIKNLTYKNTLKKIKNTVPQSSLNKEQRSINAQNSYIILKNVELNDKNIVLFDDIYTTGATVNECCKLLKKAGADKIAVLTIAKD